MSLYWSKKKITFSKDIYCIGFITTFILPFTANFPNNVLITYSIYNVAALVYVLGNVYTSGINNSHL